jgi:hypothetical protein
LSIFHLHASSLSQRIPKAYHERANHHYHHARGGSLVPEARRRPSSSSRPTDVLGKEEKFYPLEIREFFVNFLGKENGQKNLGY